jgi:toxin ParE1/3/4
LRHLDWTARAKADLADVLRYYNDVDFALGESLFVRIITAPAPLLDQPGIGSPTRKSGIRKWRVKRTPFLLFYRLRKDGALQILRVRHAAQDWAS